MKRKTKQKKLEIKFPLVAFILFFCNLSMAIYAGESHQKEAKVEAYAKKIIDSTKTIPSQANLKYEIIGYFPAWTSNKFPATPTNINAKNLTMINYAFLDICWDGKHGNSAFDHNEGGGNENFLESTCRDGAGNPVVLKNGSVTLGSSIVDAKNMRDLVALKSVNPHLKIVPSVGGWVWSNRFSDMAASAVTRASFTASAVDLVREFKLDGIDLDWE